jgi:hypothetical protein
LTYSTNCIYARLIEQRAASTVEHTIEETSKKLGETCSPGKTLEEIAIDPSSVKTFLEVLSEFG